MSLLLNSYIFNDLVNLIEYTRAGRPGKPNDLIKIGFSMYRQQDQDMLRQVCLPGYKPAYPLFTALAEYAQPNDRL